MSAALEQDLRLTFYTHSSTMRVSKDTVLGQVAGFRDKVIMVHSGTVREYLSQYDFDECDEVTIQHLGQEEIIGLEGYFGNTSPCRYQTMESCKISYMDHKEFGEFLAAYPAFAVQSAAMMSARLSLMQIRMSDYAFDCAERRIIKSLHYLTGMRQAKMHEHGVSVMIKRQDLAKHANCSREMAGRCVKRLVDKGLIQDKGRTIVVFRSDVWRRYFRPSGSLMNETLIAQTI